MNYPLNSLKTFFIIFIKKLCKKLLIFIIFIIIMSLINKEEQI